MFHVHTAKADPILLDMGEFHAPGMITTLQATALAAASANAACLSEAAQLPNSSSAVLGPRQSLECQSAAIAAAAIATVQGKAGINQPALRTLHLYSIFARPLQARGKIWKGQLNLKDDVQPVAKGFFDAPGVSVIHQPAASSGQRQRLICIC